MLIRAYRNLFLFIFIFAGVFLINGGPSFGAVSDFDHLRTESTKIKTLQAEFVQKKFMKILSKPLISEGCFFYVAPDSFRWEYYKPLKSIAIAHKNKTKRYIYSRGKLVEDKTGGAQAMNIVLSEVSGWMSGRFDQNPSFRATIHKNADTRITLTPAGKSMTGMIEKIEITLSPKSETVKSIRIFEGSDNVTQINFNNVKLNAVVNPTVFQDVP